MFLEETRQGTRIREMRGHCEQSKNTECVGDVGIMKVDPSPPCPVL